MHLIYFLTALLLTPTLALAHEGEHVTSAWYQEPFLLIILAVGTLAVALLIYAAVTKQTKLITLPALLLVGTAVAGLSTLGGNHTDPVANVMNVDFGAGQTVTLYKSPNCGCCSGHAAALEAAGFTVVVEETQDLTAIKQSHNIPLGGESCHTTLIGDYVVEGHVPLEAIEQLLAEQPDVAGIGLPGMPIGTPGMPGAKTAPYEVYQLSAEGEMSPYLTI